MDNSSEQINTPQNQPPITNAEIPKRHHRHLLPLFGFFIASLVVLATTLAYVTGFELSNSLTTQPTPTQIASQPTPTPNLTADWKIYKNKEFGFELTFNHSWKGYKAINFYDVDGNAIIFCLPTKDKTYTDSLCGEDNPGFAYVFTLNIFTQSQFSQIPKELQDPIIGKDENFIFSYSKTQNISNDLSLQFNEINQILSTFKFTDQIDTADWKTYKDKNGKFTLKIPPDWNINISKTNKSSYTFQNEYGYAGEFYYIDKEDEKNKNITYCESNPNAKTQTGDILCEVLDTPNTSVVIYWGKFTNPIDKENAVAVVIQGNQIVEFDLGLVGNETTQSSWREILSTFKFLNP